MERQASPLVALTGAGGFVGRAVAAKLQAQGFRVRALSSGRGGPVPSGLERGLERRLLPSFEAEAARFERLLEGATHLVHAGALNNADTRLGDAAYHGPNVVLTAKLAAAAARVLPGRTVFISSVRAVAGAQADGHLDARTVPAPADAYGRSKRGGELAALEAYGDRTDLAILRLPAVYGQGMKGSLGMLLRLADTPLPLPLLGIAARRSLLGRGAAADAVAHLLGTSVLPEPILFACDREPATLGDIVAAFRDGLGRPRRLLSVSAGLLAGAARLARKEGAWRVLSASQTCDASPLEASGWQPAANSRAGLAEAARQRRQAG